VKFSDRANPEKNNKDLNIYGSAAKFNVAEGPWTKQRNTIKSYGSAARLKDRFGNPRSKFY
jgi:hypothetical protein